MLFVQIAISTPDDEQDELGDGLAWLCSRLTASDSIITTAHKRMAPPKAHSLNDYMAVLASPSIQVS